MRLANCGRELNMDHNPIPVINVSKFVETIKISNVEDNSETKDSGAKC